MKKKASRRLTAAFTMAAMLVTLMPSGAAFAAPAEESGEATQATAVAAKTAPKEVAGDTQEAGKNQYVSYEWDYDQEQLIRTVKEIPRYATVVTQDNINDVWSNGMIQGGTYVIEGDVTVNGSLTVDGWADIILKDDSQLNAMQGINIDNAGLILYAQSENKFYTGKLFANGAKKTVCGLGGKWENDGGTIIIHGGHIESYGIDGPALNGRKITIYNGEVIAETKSSGRYDDSVAIGSKIDGATVNIDVYGGKISARSESGRAIGGNMGQLSIYDGTILAQGYDGGIGSDNNACSINISGGDVTTVVESNYGGVGVACEGWIEIVDATVKTKSLNDSFTNTNGVCGSRIYISGAKVYGDGIRADSHIGIEDHENIRSVVSVDYIETSGEIRITNSDVISESSISGRFVDISDSEIHIDDEYGNIKGEYSVGINDSFVRTEYGCISSTDITIEGDKSVVQSSFIAGSNVTITGGWIVGYGGAMFDPTNIQCESFTTNGYSREDGKYILGQAVIEAKSISDHSNEAEWSGLITEGDDYGKPRIGRVYGTHVTVHHGTGNWPLAWPSIVTIPKGATLTLLDDITFETYGLIINEGIINGNGILSGEGYLSGNGTVAPTIDNQLKKGFEVKLNSSTELVTEGQNLILSAEVVDAPDILKNATVEFYRGNTLLDTVPLNENGIATSNAITVSQKNGWTIGESYIIKAQLVGEYDAILGQGTCKVSVVKPAEAVPTAPSKKAVTDTSVTLNTIAKSANGAKALYGMKGTDGSFIWQDVPYFDNLKPDTDYIFATKYEATSDQAESPLSKEVIIRTAKCSKNDQPAPAAPVKKSVTASSVTLKTIADSSVGGKVQYGMKDATGVTKWLDSPVFENLKADTAYTFVTQYMATDKYNASAISAETVIRTAKSSKSDQPAPAAPVKKSVTASSVTLKTIADSSVGGKVQYGMKDATGVTKWQDSPVFENLKADTAYTFVAQYMATDKYNASAISAETVIRTEKKNSTDLLSPIIPNSTGGQTAVTVTNPKPGQAVTIITVPDKGYEVHQVKVTDENGNVIEVTKNANGQYVFNQPDTQVTIKVTYKKAVTPEEPQKPEEPETPQDDNWNNPFTDVPKGAWYNDAVRYVYENGLMVGLAPNNFGANVTTDRGQLVTMLWRMADEPQATNGADFSDVSNNAYYANAVAWAAENGITSGFEDGTFRPQTGLSREQMAALFMKYAEATGVDTSVRADISSYTDINPNSWSYDALSWAKAVGLLSGVSDTTMAPQATATRAQIAAVLQRYCETVAK